MKTKLAFLFASIGWFALILQYILILHNSPDRSTLDTTIRYFGFFTILTNTLTAVYFTAIAFGKNVKPATHTAVTVYLTTVFLVYQFLLRGLVELHAWDRLADELLHTLLPILTIIFWVMYQRSKPVSYGVIFLWTIYPLLYLAYTLAYGNSTNYYPYPFVNVSRFGMQQVLINSGLLVVGFLLMSALFLFIGKSVISR